MTPAPGSNAWDPLVSVIMPVCNEAAFLDRSLGAVLGQDYSAEKLEVIVADGMSTDGTRDIVRAFQARYPAVRLVDNPSKIVPTGLNLALQQALGNVIIRVDGHTEIAPDYARQCVSELLRTGADNVGGKMTAVGDGPFGMAVAAATSLPFGVGSARFHYSTQEEWVDTVYMGAWRREIFSRIGLFDEELVRDQDDEFNYRLRASGGRIFLSPRIKSRYTVRSRGFSLWRQYFQYGYWKVRVMQKHPRQMRARQFVPALFVGVLSISAMIAPFSVWGTRLLGAVSGSYLAANLGASALAARGASFRLLPRLPITFAVLHLAYGLGFLFGLVRFWNRWGTASEGPRSAREGAAAETARLREGRAPHVVERP